MTDRRGLSLIEVVLAIVILGLAVPPLMYAMAAGLRQQEATLIQQDLSQLASERMWEVFADHADPTRGYSYIVNAAYPDESAPRGLAGYTRQTTIREVSSTDYVTEQAGSGIKRFRIVVTGPQDASLVIESFVTNVPGAADWL
jgi:prepilin-type N-terminal cleavage/methylation domain-containing protein